MKARTRTVRRAALAALLLACSLAMAPGALAADVPGGGTPQGDVFTPPVLGSPDAPITVIEYADFQCSYCTIFAAEVKPQIEANYIDTGKVRFVFRHFPWIGRASWRAAHASDCAHEQGAFWAYHDHLYGPGRGALADEDLIDAAAELGLDVEAFTACLADASYAERVEASYREGRSLGVVSTPTFVINGYMLRGTYPYTAWQQFFELLLQETNQETDG